MLSVSVASRNRSFLLAELNCLTSSQVEGSQLQGVKNGLNKLLKRKGKLLKRMERTVLSKWNKKKRSQRKGRGLTRPVQNRALGIYEMLDRFGFGPD